MYAEMNAKSKVIFDCLKVHFTNKEMEQIESFLNRGFSQYGRLVIASIFLFAGDCQKSVPDILNECEKEWERNWQHQPLEVRGSPDVSGDAGIRNADSLRNIYQALGISFPASCATNSKLKRR